MSEIKEAVKRMFTEKESTAYINYFIAEFLKKKYTFKTITDAKNKYIWIYKDGIFKSIGKEVIEGECVNIFSGFYRGNYVNEILRIIADSTRIDRKELGCKNKNLMCVQNGVLNIETKELSQHSPEYKFINKIDINYVPKSKCPAFLEFLGEIVYEDDMLAIQEWFGYQLYRAHPIKKAVIFRGARHTGKTTLLKVLREFVGRDNYANKSLQKLSEGKWQIVKLYNKLANIADELSEKAISDVDFIKALTGDSGIDGEYKFGESFEFDSFAKNTFACNKIPKINISDNDDAYFDRWMIFDFDSQFDVTNPKRELQKHNQIIEDRKEMEGVLIWALEGLERLLEQKKFTNSKTWEENRSIMKKEDTIYGFISGCCENILGEKISKSDLYGHYEMYCTINGKNPETMIKFGKGLKQQLDFLDEANVEGSAYWRNIRIDPMKFD